MHNVHLFFFFFLNNKSERKAVKKLICTWRRKKQWRPFISLMITIWREHYSENQRQKSNYYFFLVPVWVRHFTEKCGWTQGLTSLPISLFINGLAVGEMDDDHPTFYHTQQQQHVCLYWMLSRHLAREFLRSVGTPHWSSRHKSNTKKSFFSFLFLLNK